MLRLSDLKLPLDHLAEALPAAIVERLGIAPAELLRWEVARRANDARRKSAILMVYSVDVELADEAAVLARFSGDAHVRPTPDTGYRFVARAPAGAPRTVVIGAGPCGLFAGLILDTVVRGRREMLRLAYLGFAAPGRDATRTSGD